MEKPKKIKESLFEKFSEESDPIKDMGVGKLGMFKALEKRGVRMWFDWGNRVGASGIHDGKKEGEIEKLKVVENIHEITKLVNKLEKAGFDTENMEISSATHINLLRTIQLLEGNRVIFYCATKEDAEILIKMIKMFTLWTYDGFRISVGSMSSHVSIYPEQHQWLDNLIENREKFKKLLNV